MGGEKDTKLSSCVYPNFQNSIFLQKGRANARKKIIKPSAIFGDHISENQVQLEEVRVQSSAMEFALSRRKIINNHIKSNNEDNSGQ